MKGVWVFLMLLCGFNSFGQGDCGQVEPTVPMPYSQEELRAEIERMGSGDRDGPRVFLVNFTIVRSGNGQGGLGPSTAMNALQEMNEAYLPAGIRFQLCNEISYLDNSSYLSTSVSAFDNFTFNQLIENVINIFFIPDLDSDSGFGLCGTSSFPSSSNTRRILMANSCVANGSTFIHEMGHFFNLYHTHTTIMGEEYVNGSNCNWSGDGFCDTPADPRLSSSDVSNCNYVGSETDANGDLYMPDPTNYMSYAPKSCRVNFSDEQLAAMSLCAQTDNSFIYEFCDFIDLTAYSNTDEILIDEYASYSLDFTIKNLAGIGLNDNTTLKIGLSESPENFTVASEDISIDFSESHTQTRTLEIPVDNKLLSSKYLNIWIDSEENISELIETNNRISLPITVRLPNKNLIVPNPVDDLVKVVMNNSFIGVGKYVLYTIDGQLMKEGTFNKVSAFNILEFDMSTFSPGLYVIGYEKGGDALHTLKIVKK